MPNAVEISGLTKLFRRGQQVVQALAAVNLTIQDGEFLCVVGPSGCGKTTLLNILGELEEPTSGNIRLNFPADSSPAMSIVFQEQGIFPWLTAEENAAFGLRVRGIGKEERTNAARRVLREVGLSGFENAYPRELSGGMRQRVNLARAFANDPRMLLMDEPFASLDEQTKLILQDNLLQLWERHRKTVLFITHSIDEAIRLADRIIVMTRRPGRIKAEIPVDLERPRDVFALIDDPKYNRIRGEVWGALKEEVARIA